MYKDNKIKKNTKKTKKYALKKTELSLERLLISPSCKLHFVSSMPLLSLSSYRVGNA